VTIALIETAVSGGVSHWKKLCSRTQICHSVAIALVETAASGGISALPSPRLIFVIPGCTKSAVQGVWDPRGTGSRTTRGKGSRGSSDNHNDEINSRSLTGFNRHVFILSGCCHI